MQLHKKVKHLIRRLGHNGSTRISREGMPNGFFLNDLLWFGDGGSEQTAVSRGFIVEPAEMDSMDDEAKSDLSDRLRYLLAALGEEYTLQCRYMVCSDYSEERHVVETPFQLSNPSHLLRFIHPCNHGSNSKEPNLF